MISNFFPGKRELVFLPTLKSKSFNAPWILSPDTLQDANFVPTNLNLDRQFLHSHMIQRNSISSSAMKSEKESVILDKERMNNF